MAWFYLILGGVFEIVWLMAMKYSNGFTRPWPTAITIVALALSMWTVSLSLRGIPVGTAYAVWTGIGAVGAAIFGIVVLGESAAPVRLVCLALIVAGIAGLRLAPA